MTGDTISIGAGYGTTIGVLTASALSTDTTISVTPSAINSFYLRNGGYVSVTDGTNTTGYIIVVSQDANAGTITLASALGFNFSAGAYLQFAIIFVDNVVIGAAGSYRVAENSTTSAYMPSGTVFTITYTNNGLTSKNVSFVYDFLYRSLDCSYKVIPKFSKQWNSNLKKSNFESF